MFMDSKKKFPLKKRIVQKVFSVLVFILLVPVILLAIPVYLLRFLYEWAFGEEL